MWEFIWFCSEKKILIENFASVEPAILETQKCEHLYN